MKFYSVIAVVLLLVGCANPPYKFTPDEPVAFIKPVEGQTWSFCKAGKLFGLTKSSKSPVLKVPANKKIVLTNSAVFSGYQVSYSCYPMIGFTPEEGKTYVSDLTITMTGCALGLAEVDAKSDVGLKPVLSLGSPYCPSE